MDIGKSVPIGGNSAASAPQENREQSAQNAVRQFQSVYGEKMKEARPIKKTLDKDDFMKIMITEMKHQDPTKPMEADKMATQMAQLTSVEQLKNVGVAIEKLADKNTASDRLAMSAMIGKSVTVDKGRFAHQKGNLSSLNFDLPADAQKIKLNILDERGETIAVRELEPMKAGQNTYNWDGLNESGIQSTSGSYIVRVDAEDAQGKKLAISPISRETVVGVSFEGGETNFLVGNTKSPQRVNFRNVTRIEGDATTRSAAQSNKASDLEQNRATSAAGSEGGGFSLPPELQKKFEALNGSGGSGQQVAKNSSAEVSEVPEEEVKAEGFPSGLNE
jgi:flagellar basal-body rod modification protein FlgD